MDLDLQFSQPQPDLMMSPPNLRRRGYREILPTGDPTIDIALRVSSWTVDIEMPTPLPEPLKKPTAYWQFK